MYKSVRRVFGGEKGVSECGVGKGNGGCGYEAGEVWLCRRG